MARNSIAGLPITSEGDMKISRRDYSQKSPMTIKRVKFPIDILYM